MFSGGRYFYKQFSENQEIHKERLKNYVKLDNFA